MDVDKPRQLLYHLAYTIRMDGKWIAKVAEMIESEKVIIGISDVDLRGQDLVMVSKFFGNQQNFINIAIQNQLLSEKDRLDALDKETMQVGFVMFTRGGNAYRLA